LFRSNALTGTGDGAREDDYPVIRPNLERHFQAVIIANFVLNRRFQLEIILPTGASGSAEREENNQAQQAESDVTPRSHKVNPCKVRCRGASDPEGILRFPLGVLSVNRFNDLLSSTLHNRELFGFSKQAFPPNFRHGATSRGIFRYSVTAICQIQTQIQNRGQLALALRSARPGCDGKSQLQLRAFESPLLGNPIDHQRVSRAAEHVVEASIGEIHADAEEVGETTRMPEVGRHRIEGEVPISGAVAGEGVVGECSVDVDRRALPAALLTGEDTLRSVDDHPKMDVVAHDVVARVSDQVRHVIDGAEIEVLSYRQGETVHSVAHEFAVGDGRMQCRVDRGGCRRRRLRRCRP
jgi:hypothetical protein